MSMMGPASVKLRDTRIAEVVTSMLYMSVLLSGHLHICGFVDCEILWTYCVGVLQVSKMCGV